MRSIQEVLSHDTALLRDALNLTANEARIEVQMLLRRALGVTRAYLLAHPERVLNTSQQETYEATLQRRLRGEPIAYIFGEREFFGLDFAVTPATLIPRPETELLVEEALRRIPPHSARRVLDMGTGSGAIALSIAYARPEAEVTAVDASVSALDVARENARRLQIANVRFQQSDWFSALGGQRYDLIVSNPPYIPASDVHLTQGDVRFEPQSALVSGVDGLDDIRHIIMRAATFLEHGAWLLLEHGYDQATAVRSLLEQSGFVEIVSMKDLAGIERVSGGCVC